MNCFFLQVLNYLKIYCYLNEDGGKMRTPPTGGAPVAIEIREAPSCLAATSVVIAFFGTGAPLLNDESLNKRPQDKFI